VVLLLVPAASERGGLTGWSATNNGTRPQLAVRVGVV
jgi:hypothetical protein